MKIQPLTVGEIQQLASRCMIQVGGAVIDADSVERLILAWAHERARGNMFKRHLMWVSTGTLGADPKREWDNTDWLNEVLDSVNWPKDQR
jgi:hypothetical protein